MQKNMQYRLLPPENLFNPKGSSHLFKESGFTLIDATKLLLNKSPCLILSDLGIFISNF